VLVTALLLAARDFKFLQRILRRGWLEPHILHARAQGIAPARLLMAHILPAIVPHICALIGLSIVTALSALVPVEVIFDIPGLGQLAWNAALNRDLPVLVAVTLIMAVAVTCSGIAPSREAEWERA
jgi:peptide/nickel transport system permease protein